MGAGTHKRIEAYTMGDLGLIGPPYPRKFGRQSVDCLSYILPLEEIPKADASIGISCSVYASLYCATFDNAGASDEFKRKHIVPVAQGKSLGSFVLAEPVGPQ